MTRWRSLAKGVKLGRLLEIRQGRRAPAKARKESSRGAKAGMLGPNKQGLVAGKARWQVRPGGRRGLVAGRASGKAGTPWWQARQEAQPDNRQMAR